MDSVLSGTIRHLLEGDGVKNIGSDSKSEIVLGGIKYEHAILIRIKLSQNKLLILLI